MILLSASLDLLGQGQSRVHQGMPPALAAFKTDCRQRLWSQQFVVNPEGDGGRYVDIGLRLKINDRIQ